ncbi:MAG: formylglycine-generating enzyme family protein [Bdellovibrionales bacterium]|nr:formylglycine-generating enzyme family protein [Bdellovibrionales bacterium]
MYKLLMILGLVLGSCSKDDENPKSGELKTNGEPTSSDASGQEEPVQATTQTPEAPGHWIFSVPFRKIDAGSFQMGSPDGGKKYGQSDEGPVPVTITKAFEIMEKELTQKQWFLLKKKNPSEFKESGDCHNYEIIEGVEMCPNHPVERVSWDDVQDYIRELNTELGLTGCDGTPNSKRGCYRLPTEAEWEWAVKGKTTTAYFFSDDPANLGKYAHYGRNSGGKTHEVGRLKANRNGLYDVYGNVWEWVQDKWIKELPGGRDPLNKSGSYPVLRGGGWINRAQYLRSANRYNYYPDLRHFNIGFRLVRTL